MTEENRKDNITIIEHGAEVETPIDNIMEADIVNVNSKVIFKGKGNRLVTIGKVRLTDSTISFNGDNALLVLSEHIRHPYKIKLDLWRETTTYFGRNSYFNGLFRAIVSERKNLIVGSEGVFSFGIWVRTADPHLIYNTDNHRRINTSKSVLIGDHVWIGQNATILKGSVIGSGSIVSANAVVANKTLGSNAVFAGNPVKRVRGGVFFWDDSVHNYTASDTEKYSQYSGNEYIYGKDGNPITISSFDEAMKKAGNDVMAREEVLRDMLIKPGDHNRFYIKDKGEKRGLFSK